MWVLGCGRFAVEQGSGSSDSLVVSLALGDRLFVGMLWLCGSLWNLCV